MRFAGREANPNGWNGAMEPLERMERITVAGEN
jgi:hypothetical protein